jgi:hypothetical protein
MALEIGAVEEPFAVGFHQHRIGVEPVVVIQESRYQKWADLQLLAVTQEIRRLQVNARTTKELGLSQKVGYSLAHVERDFPRDLIDEALMILMAVGDQESQEIWVASIGQSRNRRQRYFLTGIGIERPAHVEDDPSSFGFDLDAVAANFSCPSVDANFHHASGNSA